MRQISNITRSLRTMALAALALTASLSTAVITAPAIAAPEPSPVPTRWELEFRPGPLRFVALDVEGQGVRHFAFLTYRVTNYSGADRLFAPSFELMTDDGRVVRSGRNIAPDTTDRILASLENPLIQNQLQIVDVLLQGRENAKFGLVIFPLEDLTVDEIRVFASGFSGESTVYFTEDPDTGERVRHVLRKTMQLQYDLPGELTAAGDDPIEATTQRWIMR